MLLIEFTDKGLFCPQGNFYIDPWKPVDKALITHAHSDHARWGSKSYLCHTYSKPILQLRLGDNFYQTAEWNENIFINGVKISFHPAGHVIGSSQIRIEFGGEVWVVSGDYKVVNDCISGQFEPVACNTFITESTFGLPIYKWKSPQQINKDIQNWVLKNQAEGRTSVLIAYSLGKAQRVLRAIAEVTQNIFVHGAIYNIHETLLNAGWDLPAVKRVTFETKKDELAGSVVVAPPSADGTPWMKKFTPYSVGVCSGWMQVRGNARRRNVDAGFAMSDHADWPGLLQAVKATGAEKVFVTHGFQATFSRYLNEIGIEAGEVKTEYGNDEETPPTSPEGEALETDEDFPTLSPAGERFKKTMDKIANDIKKLLIKDHERDTSSSPSGVGGFANLVKVLGTSTKTNDKLEALSHYFEIADDKDKVWVIALFSGRKPKRAVNTTQLVTWCVEVAGLPGWLFGESYHTVGDLAETISLLLPETISPEQQHENEPLYYYIEKFKQIEKQDESIKRQFIIESWEQMDQNERFVFNKLITGAFRIGVSQKMMVNALAKFTSLEPSVIAHRISGNWDPSTTTFAELLNESPAITDYSKPYPFYLAYALDEDPATLGEPNEWQVEWKWDGIRGQMIKRNNQLFVWSRGEELMTEKFPEYNCLKDLLPDGTVLDGEIIPSVDQKPLPFALLQTRIGRKNITKKNLQDTPITFFAYDLLEYNYEDWRIKPLSERRKQLEKIIEPLTTPTIILSPVISFSNWDELSALRKTSRENGAEGFMIKRKSSIYQVGRKTGDWWKWKIEPLVIDCVMIYAEKGSGRRSNLYTAYTFAVKYEDKLVAFTRAYSGLTDKEFNEVDSFVKRNSIEKFGPVRTVKPELVFEIAFEGIAASNRHKSGVALRFPRINRWRKDKKPDEINTLEDLKKMLEVYGRASNEGLRE